ncbi:MAG: T9SS type A sorting domain-containing protein [Flavobacteriales bacterium]|nr:T9SS type A sorting domain-containing protein [Flavobacteriales bacterium]
MQLQGGAWKKFKVDGFTAATNSFAFTWANLDGSDEQSGSLLRSAYPGKNFGYYNLATNTAVDLEPAAATWDLLFTKYIGFVTQPFPSMYPVAGVLQNREVEALQVDGVPTADATYWGGTFSADINIIGFDWKNFNQGTFQWEYAQDRTYFVKDRVGDIYKLVFTAYGGSANGNMTFNQELVGQASIDEAGRSSALVIAPNPASNTATLIIAAEANAAQLTIVDLNGRVAMQQQLTGLNGLVQRPIDVSALPAGLFIVRVQGDGIEASVRFVKD